MSSRFPWSFGKATNKSIVEAPEPSGLSSGEAYSTSGASTPSTHKTQKTKFKFPSWSLASTASTGNLPPPAAVSAQKVQSAGSLGSLPIKLPFKPDLDNRAREIEIYDKGLVAVDLLQKLAGLTGPGCPNPVVPILETLTGILTQLQQMVKNEVEWKQLYQLIVEHFNTFNRQLDLLKLGNVAPDSNSALHEPIVQYSTTLQELTAQVLKDAGFDPNGPQGKPAWNRLKGFVTQYWQAGETAQKIEDYQQRLSNAMDLLLRDHVLFAAVKAEETNVVVKESRLELQEVHAELKEVNVAMQKMSDRVMPMNATRSSVFAKSLPAVSPYFVVRQEELDRMIRYITEPRSSHQKILAITGMGGCGKTQLVSYFMQELNQNDALFAHVIVIEALSDANIKADLQLWAQSLGAGHEQDDWKSALQILAHGPHGGRWALIVDNADDPKLKLKPFFPKCSHGTIIITSRNPSVGYPPDTYHLELEKMSKEDALATLENAADRKLQKPSVELESAQTLMEELGCLPLALVHAGTYCRHQSPPGADGTAHPFTFGQYLSFFRRRRAALMNNEESFTQDDYEHGVYTALDLSYEAVKASSKLFLHIIANFQYSEIPLAMFLAAATEGFQDPNTYLPRPDDHEGIISELTTLFCTDGESDELKLRNLISNLRSFSLLSPIEGSMFLRIHPLVQAWVRDMPSPDMAKHQTMAKQVVTACCIDGNVHLFRYILPHINEIMENGNYASVHVNDKMAFGRTLNNTGYSVKAEVLFKEVLDTLRDESEEETENMITVTAWLSTNYWTQGLWKEAERLEVDIVEKLKKLLGADHPESIQAAVNLALTYRDQARWKEAEQLQIEVMERLTRSMGPDHPSTLRAMSDLAVTYSMQEKETEAEPLKLQVLEKRKEILGEDHVDTITSVANLAVTYYNQDRFDEAERLEEDVLEKRKRILGMSHPDTLMVADSLAATYCSQGKWQNAEALLELVVEQSIRVMGKKHPRPQLYIDRLADVYEKLEKLDKAEEMKKLIVPITEKTTTSDTLNATILSGADGSE